MAWRQNQKSQREIGGSTVTFEDDDNRGSCGCLRPAMETETHGGSVSAWFKRHFETQVQHEVSGSRFQVRDSLWFGSRFVVSMMMTMMVLC
ncbi:hypothetical protein Hanom_Chr17g01588901 [Helianthus anomalus]